MRADPPATSSFNIFHPLKRAGFPADRWELTAHRALTRSPPRPAAACSSAVVPRLVPVLFRRKLRRGADRDRAKICRQPKVGDMSRLLSLPALKDGASRRFGERPPFSL